MVAAIKPIKAPKAVFNMADKKRDVPGGGAPGCKMPTKEMVIIKMNDIFAGTSTSFRLKIGAIVINPKNLAKINNPAPREAFS
jgi:hypothetical protein